MGNDLSELRSQREEDFVDQIQSEKFVLKKELTNYFRKSFLKTLKTVLIIQSEVYKDTRTNNEKIKIEKERKMSRSEEVNSHIFDGRDYGLWKDRILLYLEYKKCGVVAIREKTDDDNEQEWSEKDVKARQCIVNHITNDQLQFIRQEKSAYDIMKKFDQLHLAKASRVIVNVRNKLGRMKLKDFENSKTFFVEFEKHINDLRSAGAHMDETEKLNYLLGTLPDSMDYMADLIEALPLAERTCDFIKQKLERQEEKMRSGQHQKKSSVFKVEQRRELSCFTCGGKGHFKRDCPSQSKRGFGNHGPPGGNRSNQRGGARYQQQQHQQQQQQQQQQRGRGGGYSRGYSGAHRGNFSSRGRQGWQQQSAGGGGSFAAADHDARYSERRDDFSGSFLALTQCKDNLNLNNNFNFQADQYGNKNNNVEIFYCGYNKIEWLLDSGCTDHIINDDFFFSESIFLKEPINVKVADGRILKGTKVGKIIAYFMIGDTQSKIVIPNVIYVKNIDRNLISLSKVTDKNKILCIENTAEIYNNNDKLIAVAHKNNGLYKMSSFVENEKNCNVSEVSKMTLKEKYHRMLGHMNFDYLNKMCKRKLVDGLPNELESVYLKCGTCLMNKMHNLPFRNNRERAMEILGIVHTDLNGPQKYTGYEGSRYFLSFVDDLSRLAVVFTIKSKAEVYECFKNYLNKVENLTGKTVKKLRCDNGKEYLNGQIYDLASEKGIEIEPCPPHVHELNGVAEKFNRDVMNSARCLLYEAGVNKIYWPEVVKTACYIKNRVFSSSTLENKTPFELFFNKRPNLSNLKLYGSKVFIRVPEVKRESKWDRKADVGVLLGYENVGYRVLVNGRITVARHVDIVENKEELIGFRGYDDSENESLDSDDESQHSESNVFIDNEENKEIENSNENKKKKKISPQKLNENKENVAIRKSTRERKRPDYYSASFAKTKCIYVNVVSADSPANYNEALASDESVLWQEAMNKEMDCVIKNKTWKLVEKPENAKVLDLKWVFTNKSDGRKKARIVVRGFQQSEILEDLYSPVARVQTLKLLFSYCCQFGLKIYQLDVETAFLNGYVKSDVFVKQPIGYTDKTNRVCKLIKALYGLRESPRAWYECFDNYIRSLNFTRSENDYCLYTRNVNDDMIYLILFVDDLLICGKNESELNKIKIKLSEKFAMKDLGIVQTYLGIKINYDHKTGNMTLDQSDYIDSLARKYDIVNSKLYSTPMEQNLSLEPAQSASDNLNYRNLIGALLYISTSTRLDVSYSVNYLSRFQNGYNETHYKYALRILKYLYLTRELKLTFRRNFNSDLIDAYVDADWAGDKVDRKSTTGYVIRIFGNAIYWKSRKQGSVTKSSTAAEYVALSDVVSQVRVILNLLEDFCLKIEKPVKIYEDNSGAVAIAKFGNLTKNSKYIEIHYHFVNECYERKIINIVKIESENNIADILTKALGRNKFEAFRLALRIV